MSDPPSSTHRATSARNLRLWCRLVVGLVGGVVAGLVCGIIARLLMRVVAVVTGGDGEFSWAATLGILVVFVVAAVPGTVLAAVYRGRGRAVLLVAMSLLLAVPATSVATDDLAEVSDLSTAAWLGAGLATAGIYAVIGAMPVLALWLVRVGRTGQSPRTRPRSAFVSPR